jgi:hypothetical protein
MIPNVTSRRYLRFLFGTCLQRRITRFTTIPRNPFWRNYSGLILSIVPSPNGSLIRLCQQGFLVAYSSKFRIQNSDSTQL